MVSTFRKLAGTEATQRLLVGMGKIRQWFELFEERIGYPGGNILQASANMELAPFKTYLWGWSWCESQIYKCDLSGDFSAPWLLGSSSWTHSLYPAHHEQFYLPSFHCARSRQWMKSLTKVRHKMVEVLFQRVQDEKKRSVDKRRVVENRKCSRENNTIHYVKQCLCPGGEQHSRALGNENREAPLSLKVGIHG